MKEGWTKVNIKKRTGTKRTLRQKYLDGCKGKWIRINKKREMVKKIDAEIDTRDGKSMKGG